ncbi:hypothetical protein MRX96_042610 [Rhipicephalus microplus]
MGVGASSSAVGHARADTDREHVACRSVTPRTWHQDASGRPRMQRATRNPLQARIPCSRVPPAPDGLEGVCLLPSSAGCRNHPFYTARFSFEISLNLSLVAINSCMNSIRVMAAVHHRHSFYGLISFLTRHIERVLKELPVYRKLNHILG